MSARSRVRGPFVSRLRPQRAVQRRGSHVVEHCADLSSPKLHLLIDEPAGGAGDEREPEKENAPNNPADPPGEIWVNVEVIHRDAECKP